MTDYIPITSARDEPELAQAIGDVILAWTLAENSQINLFGTILNVTPIQASRLYQKLPNFRSRTAALVTLIELNPDYETMRPFVVRLGQLSKTRNGYIHGFFLRKIEGSEIRLIDLDQPVGTDKRSKPTKPHDMSNHAETVRRCAMDFEMARLVLPLQTIPGIELLPETTQA